MIIRTVEDARENLRRILWDIRNNQPSDLATLEAAKAAVERMRANEQSTDSCLDCGQPRKEHHYNGACYGVCGQFRANGQFTK